MEPNDPTSIQTAIEWITTNQKYLDSLFRNLQIRRGEDHGYNVGTHEIPTIEKASEEQQEYMESITRIFEGMLLKRPKAKGSAGSSKNANFLGDPLFEHHFIKNSMKTRGQKYVKLVVVKRQVDSSYNFSCYSIGCRYTF